MQKQIFVATEQRTKTRLKLQCPKQLQNQVIKD